jgi:hypothetical protein
MSRMSIPRREFIRQTAAAAAGAVAGALGLGRKLFVPQSLEDIDRGQVLVGYRVRGRGLPIRGGGRGLDRGSTLCDSRVATPRLRGSGMEGESKDQYEETGNRDKP